MCETPGACSVKLHETQSLCIAKRVVVQLAELLRALKKQQALSLQKRKRLLLVFLISFQLFRLFL